MISQDVTTFGGPLQATERPTPQPTGSQVLLRTLAAGVCHSDIHTWQGFYDLGQGKRLEMGPRGVHLPLTLGHEIVGEVVAAGPDAVDAVPGQRRLVYPWIGCGQCRICQRGREHLCPKPAFLGIFRDGGYASHVLVPHPRYLLDIGDLAPAQAAPYACSGLTAFSAIHKVDASVLAEEPVVVIGAGGVGLMAVSLLGRLAGRPPVVVEPDAGRRQAALDAGASAAIDPNAAGAA
ncbi:MAG: alcohol dehydrogenase, partial [Burkholderiales bacterium PBB5]